jgi:hypothetical protein
MWNQSALIFDNCFIYTFISMNLFIRSYMWTRLVLGGQGAPKDMTPFTRAKVPFIGAKETIGAPNVGKPS